MSLKYELWIIAASKSLLLLSADNLVFVYIRQVICVEFMIASNSLVLIHLNTIISFRELLFTDCSFLEN